MHPADCPFWEYKDHPNVAELAKREKITLRKLADKSLSLAEILSDTRPFHRSFFECVTSVEHSYFAGHYRGEDFRCLKHLSVCVAGDSRVGTPPETVHSDLAFLNGTVQQRLPGLFAGQQLPNAVLSEADKLLYVVRFACLVLCEFMRIHPFANGNGHVGRFLVWAALTSFGYWPKRWPLNNRPQDPPYSVLLSQYRDGDRDPLERFVLQCIG
jgi:hypothetical protein